MDDNFPLVRSGPREQSQALTHPFAQHPVAQALRPALRPSTAYVRLVRRQAAATSASYATHAFAAAAKTLLVVDRLWLGRSFRQPAAGFGPYFLLGPPANRQPNVTAAC